MYISLNHEACSFSYSKFCILFINETDVEFCFLLFSLENPLAFYFVYVCLAITFTGINNNIKKNINPGRSDIMFILHHRFMAILIQFASADFYFSNHNFLTTCFFMTFDQ